MGLMVALRKGHTFCRFKAFIPTCKGGWFIYGEVVLWVLTERPFWKWPWTNCHLDSTLIQLKHWFTGLSLSAFPKVILDPSIWDSYLANLKSLCRSRNCYICLIILISSSSYSRDILGCLKEWEETCSYETHNLSSNSSPTVSSFMTSGKSLNYQYLWFHTVKLLDGV